MRSLVELIWFKNRNTTFGPQKSSLTLIHKLFKTFWHACIVFVWIIVIFQTIWIHFILWIHTTHILLGRFRKTWVAFRWYGASNSWNSFLTRDVSLLNVRIKPCENTFNFYILSRWNSLLHSIKITTI